jgi:dolichol-phosphate mannosyltransferase
MSDTTKVIEKTELQDPRGGTPAGQSSVDQAKSQSPIKATSKMWVLLPAFNEQAAIEPLIQKIYMASNKVDLNLEIVVVDDASTDETAQIVSQLSFNGPVNLVQHAKNQGLAGAMRTGFGYILKHGDPGDIVVSLDADDTQPPATIPKMITMIEEGYDVVIASRYQPGSRTIGVPANRLAMTWFAKWLFKVITPIPGVWDYTCGFRSYRFSTLKTASDFYGDQFVSERGFSCMVDVLLKMRRFKFVMGEVPMLLRYDQKDGPSKMKIATTAMQTLKLLVKRRFQG